VVGTCKQGHHRQLFLMILHLKAAQAEANLETQYGEHMASFTTKLFQDQDFKPNSSSFDTAKWQGLP